MKAPIDHLLNRASAAEIAAHLASCDADFVPPLSARVEIEDYAQKIADKATRFEAWSGGTLVGLVATYCDDREERIAYITSVSVLQSWTGNGIAKDLLRQCVAHARLSGMKQIRLEVASANAPAIKLYERSGFVGHKSDAPVVIMNLYLESGEQHDK